MEDLENSVVPAQRTGAGLPSLASSIGTEVDASVYNSRIVTLSNTVLDRNHIVARRARDPSADVFRILRTKVIQALNRGGYNSLAITSPGYGDGKTTIAVNLALSIALDVKKTVCLVDVDFRHPSVHRALGIEPTVGLGDYLVHGTPISDCLIRPSFDRIVVLPIARPLDNSSETLGIPQMAILTEELKDRYPDRLIIYDLPPLLTQDDTISFLPHVDAALLVVREGFTSRRDILRATTLLSDVNVIGTVLNHSDEINPEAPARRVDL